MPEFILTESDLLSETHFPVQAIFNSINNKERFIRILDSISQGHGFGENYGACVFPNDLDEYDIAMEGSFDGVEFGLHNGEDILLDYKTFYYYLKIVCDRYLQNNPDEERIVNKFLSIFCSSYKIMK